MRADSWTRVGGGPRGRDSVRITSRGAYGDSLVVLDVAHMPAGCATWPAFWTLSQRGPWPHGGEIDIIEGARALSLVSRLPSPLSSVVFLAFGNERGLILLFFFLGGKA